VCKIWRKRDAEALNDEDVGDDEYVL